MPRTPDLDQLLHLVDRAERGTLLAPEALALRAGIRALAERAHQAARTAAGLQARAQQLAAERDTARRQTALADPHRHACPYCHAQPGQRCRPMRGIQPPPTPHVARLDTATRNQPN